jgi:hypothetical protein
MAERFTTAAKSSPLTDIVMRALQETGGWSVKAMRAPGFRMLQQVIEDGGFRALAPLPEKAQVVLDKAVVEVGLQRLTFVADLLAEGLTYPLADPMSLTQLEWYAQNRVGAAQRTMSPSARGENKMLNLLQHRLPIYLTTDQFEIDIRTLKMSERVGLPIDTALVKSCIRSVNEATEDAAINGATTLDGQALVDAGYSAPGLLNAPNANTYQLTADWTTAGVLGTWGLALTADVQAMAAKLAADKKFGPYNLYLGTNAGIAMQSDYKVNTTDTVQSRLEQMEFGGRKLRIRFADMMPNASTGVQAVLVQMTSDVVDIVTGQPPTVIPWTSLDGFTIHNLVMTIQIPRVRSDYDGNSGICIGTK